MPQVEKAAHNATGLKIAANVIETAVPGVKGNVVAKIAAVVIEDFANEIPTSAEPQVKLLSSDLKQEIEAHPYRGAVKEFFKIFLPKMLKTFETVGVALAPMLETMAKEAIKKSVPGETGEILATITGQAIQTTKKMAEDSLKKDANLAKLPKADDKAAAKLVTHDDEMPQSSAAAEVAADYTDMPSFEVPQVAMTGSTPDVHADVL